MALVRIDTRHLVTEFDGEIIAGPVSTGYEPRWVEFTIYRRLDGPAGYVVHKKASSWVYHTSDTTCMTAAGRPSGGTATVDDLPDEAVPCERCQPPAPVDLRDDEPIRFEFPRHTIDRCPTAGHAVERLTTMNPRNGGRAVVVSEPVEELLAQAAVNDEGFAQARPVQKL